MPDRRLLLAVLVLALLGHAFVEIADEVLEGSTQSFDQRALRALRDEAGVPVGPAWLPHAARDLTAFGSHLALLLVTGSVAGWLALAGRGRTALFLLAAVLTGMGLGHGLKAAFDRARPDVVEGLVRVTSPSFPSGHALLSAVTYLTLGALLARVASRRRLRVYPIALAIVLTLLIGASRIYLGVHYPTDVLAGWTAGALWALLCRTGLRFLERRGTVEPTVSGKA